MISKEVLSEVLGFNVIPATGSELMKSMFGYSSSIKTKCSPPITTDE